MKKYYARKGEIPRQGEIWLPVGDKGHLMMLHLFDIERIKSFIPEELDIVSIWPGKTLGLVFMTSMGPESTLPYHELIIAPALIRVKCRIGFFVTHIYVDNEKSRIGGIRNFGLEKKLADFSWDWVQGKPGQVNIKQDGKSLMSIAYGNRYGNLTVKLGGSAFSILEDKLIFCKNRLRANYGLAEVSYEIPDESPIRGDLEKIGLKKPVLSVLGENMRGTMGEETQIVAFLPERFKAKPIRQA